MNGQARTAQGQLALAPWMLWVTCTNSSFLTRYETSLWPCCGKNVINHVLCPKGPPGSGGLKGEAGEMGPQVRMGKLGDRGDLGGTKARSSQSCFRGCCEGAIQ